MIHISDARLLAKRASASVDICGGRALFIRGHTVIGSTIITDDCVSRHALKRILGWEQETQ